MRELPPQSGTMQFAERINAELSVLVGEPIVDCWRAGNMQVFEFGAQTRVLNRNGVEVEAGDLRLHVQCRWRFTDPTAILFGCDHRWAPAETTAPAEEFDTGQHPSLLERLVRSWLKERREPPCRVVDMATDPYGGFRMTLEGGCALEVFPCHSGQSEHSEHWRLIGPRSTGQHFVVTGEGIEIEHARSADSPPK